MKEIDLTNLNYSKILSASLLLFCLFEVFSYPNQIQLHSWISDNAFYLLASFISANLFSIIWIGRNTLTKRVVGFAIVLITSFVFFVLNLLSINLNFGYLNREIINNSSWFCILVAVAVLIPILSYWLGLSSKKLHRA